MHRIHHTTRVVILGVLVALGFIAGCWGESPYRLILGAGARYSPEHNGSEQYEWGFCPLIKGDWHKGNLTLYVEGTEAGITFTPDTTLPVSFSTGVLMGESRDTFSNPFRLFLTATYGSDRISLNARVSYAPFWESGDFSGHGVISEVYIHSSIIRIPVIFSGNLGIRAMDSSWSSGYFREHDGLLGAYARITTLLFLRKNMGLFTGGTITRYLGPAEESSVTEKTCEGSVLFGLFYMTGNKP